MFLRQKVKFNPSRFPKLADQLSGYVYMNEDRTSFGPYTKSLHDDLVDALMLALSFASRQAATPPDTSVWRPIRKLKHEDIEIKSSKWFVDQI